jgi:hypothetical protein
MSTMRISKIIYQILEENNMDPKEVLWDCHGTHVMYHRFIEQIAVENNMTTEFDRVLYAQDNNVAIVIKGKHGDRSEWTTGEASPKNCKNMYPWAMAEKRAKDRVILKLIGLAGHVYSDQDIADQNNNKNIFEIEKSQYS